MLNACCPTFKPREVAVHNRKRLKMTVCANCGCLPHDSAPPLVAIDDETREALGVAIKCMDAILKYGSQEYQKPEIAKHIAALEKLANNNRQIDAD